MDGLKHEFQTMHSAPIKHFMSSSVWILLYGVENVYFFTSLNTIDEK